MSISTPIRKFSLNIWSLTLSQLTYRLVSLVLAVYMARALGAGDLGMFYTAMGVIGIVTAFTDLGVTNLVIKEISQDRSLLHSYFRNFLSLEILVGIVLSAFIAGIGPIIGYAPLTTEALLIGCISPLLAGGANCVNAALSAQELLYPFALIELICMLFYAAANILFMVAGLGILALVAAGTMTAGLKLLLAAAWGRKFGLRFAPAFDRRLLRGFILLGFPFLLFNGIHFALQRIDAIILPVFMDQASTGHFLAASRLIFSLLMFSTVAGAALYPTMARLVKTQPARASEVAGTAAIFLALTGVSLSLCCALFGRDIISLLYGAGFSPSAPPFALLGCIIPFFGVGLVYGNVLVVGGRIWRAVLVSAGSILLLFAASAVAIPRYGIAGMAMALLAAECARSAGFIHGAGTGLGMRIPRARILMILCAGAGCFLLSLLLPPLPMPATPFLVLALFLSATLLLRIVRADELRDVMRILALPLRRIS